MSADVFGLMRGLSALSARVWPFGRPRRWGGHICLLSLLCVLSACQSGVASSSLTPAPSASPSPVKAQSADAAYERAAAIISHSCMPCHNRQTLPEVMALTQAASFQKIGNMTRARILGELGKLKTDMDNGLPISFTSKQALEDFFKVTRGEFYVRLEKGLMPPAWAPEWMQELKWGYQRLDAQERLELMRFARPYAENYLQ